MKKIFLTCIPGLLVGSLTLTAADSADRSSNRSQSSDRAESSSWSQSTADRAHSKAAKEKYALDVGGLDAHLVTDEKMSGKKKSTDRILGADVVDNTGERIGSITDLLLDDDTIEAVHISVGGVLGLGGDTISIAFDNLSEAHTDSDALQYQLDVSRQALEQSIDRATARIENEERAESTAMSARQAVGEDRNSQVASVEREIDSVLAEYARDNQTEKPEIDVREEGGSVVLSGTVGSHDLRDELEEAAQDAAGDNVAIQNRIEVSTRVAGVAN